jgi:hypothetical protein
MSGFPSLVDSWNRLILPVAGWFVEPCFAVVRVRSPVGDPGREGAGAWLW